MSDDLKLSKALADLYDYEVTQVELLDDERFQEKKLLGEGAVKLVYKVYDNHCQREVAFATMKATGAPIYEKSDFINEVQLASSLEHPNIARIYDIGIINNSPWFTMELIEGDTLDVFLSQNKVSLAEKLDIFIQICNAVQYAHEAKILHLDLKPNNISIGKNHEVLLYDWGLGSSVTSTKNIGTNSKSSLNISIKGTPGYMSPEQIDAKNIKNKSSDIFSLGAILFYLLNEKPPFKANSIEETLENTRTGCIQTVTNSNLPIRLSAIYKKALMVSAKDRYPSVKLMIKDINKYRNGYTILAENASIFTIISLFIKRYKTICLILFIFITSIITITSTFVYHLKLSETKAISSRNSKEQALVKLRKKQAENKVITSKLVSSLILNNREVLQSIHFNKALKYAQQSVEFSSEHKIAHNQLGFTYFAMQDFKNALKHLTISQRPGTKDLLILAQEYAKKDEILSGEETVELVKKIPFRRNLCYFILNYDVRIKNTKDHLKLIVHFLNTSNDTKNITYSYNNEALTLDLSQNPTLSTLYSSEEGLLFNHNILSTLKLNELILPTSFNSPDLLARLKVELDCIVKVRKN